MEKRIQFFLKQMNMRHGHSLPFYAHLPIFGYL